MITKIRSFLLFALLLLPMPAIAQSLPVNVTVIKPSELVLRIETSTKPFILLVFASWCPYCKKQIDRLTALTPEQRTAIPQILAVSIDAQPEAFSRMRATYPGLFFETRIYEGNASLEALLHNYASRFNGGIPYLAVFHNKKIIKEFNGLINPVMLAQ